MKELNKLEIINKLRVIRLNILQNQYNLEAGSITEEEFKKQYKILKREVKKLEKQCL